MPRTPSLAARRAFVMAVVLFACAARAEAPAPEALLEQTSRQVSAFLEQVSDVRCTEQVTQFKLGKNGHPEYTETSTYDYLILLEGSADDLLLSESRIPGKDSGKPAKNISLLISNGFSTLFLIFHPYYRTGFQFTALGDDAIAGRRMLRVRFTHIPGKRTPAALAVRGREYPLELTGTAWIDAETGMVARIETTLADDMRDVGLRALSAEIDYLPVKLPGWSQAYRFPATVTVDVETLRQHWRNVHRFSQYQRFMVGTSQAVAKPEDK